MLLAAILFHTYDKGYVREQLQEEQNHKMPTEIS